VLEVGWKSNAEIEGDEVAFKGLAGLKKGFFIGRSQGQNIVRRGQTGETMILGGIGKVKGTAAEDMEAWRRGERKR